MSDPDSRSRDSRLEHLAPGVPVAAKLVLLPGLAGGLVVTIVLSYADPDRQYVGLGVGIALGLAGALLLTLRSKRNHG